MNHDLPANKLPFEPVSDRELDDLRERLFRTRFALLPGEVGWHRGTDEEFLHALVQFWRNSYDWRTHEAQILALPWQTVGQDDHSLRVVHQPADNEEAPTVLLLHGWPDSVLRFARVLPLLSDVNVVVPALPGFPFACELRQTGMTTVRMASLIAESMAELGYEKYVVSGGDVGVSVAEHLAAMHPDRITALHLTSVSPLHAAFVDRAILSEEEIAYLDGVAQWRQKEGGYIAEQSTKPHTLAPALADSPTGLASWLVEKLQGWSDVPFTSEDLLTWISIYWFTGTIGTSFAPYVEFARPADYIATPTVLSVFEKDINPVIRSFASRFVNLQEFLIHKVGGHFSAWEQPEQYVQDLRRAFAIAEAVQRTA